MRVPQLTGSKMKGKRKATREGGANHSRSERDLLVVLAGKVDNKTRSEGNTG